MEVVIPKDGMKIFTSVRFKTGIYSLPHGIEIHGNDVILDMNNAVLQGEQYQGFGIAVRGCSNVTIQQGSIHGYFYGIGILSSESVALHGLNCSSNWRDPRSPDPPLLDLTAPPLADRTNSGGGFLVLASARVRIDACLADHNLVGLHVHKSSGVVLARNHAAACTAWGLRLSDSCDSVAAHNRADRTVRGTRGCTAPGCVHGTAGILVTGASRRVSLFRNSLRFCGSGVLLAAAGPAGGAPREISIIENDATGAARSCFEVASPCEGMQLLGNLARLCGTGIHLSHARGALVVGNHIAMNVGDGVVSERGVGVEIARNVIRANLRSGVVLDHPAGAIFRNNTLGDNRAYGLDIRGEGAHAVVYNNAFCSGMTARCSCSPGVVWAIPLACERNIVGGAWVAGNYWHDYRGRDTTGNGIGDTEVPYTAHGALAPIGDPAPLVLPNRSSQYT